MKKFFNIISFVFGMGMLFYFDVFDVFSTTWIILALLGTFLFTGILPATPILLLMRKGEVHDLFISRREERTMPYLFSFLAYTFWSFFLYKVLQLPLFMVGMGIGTATSILLITFINLKWKISAHLSGIGGLAGGVFGICYRMAYNPVSLLVIILFISALVAISRIGLKAHTPGQTLAGFILAFFSVFIPCVLL